TIFCSVAPVLLVFNDVKTNHIIPDCSKPVYSFYRGSISRIMQLRYKIRKLDERNIRCFFPITRELVFYFDLDCTA
ncbi:hypothetical protein J6Y50_04535, partial [bacterium]|nr:hypothetical protein [bacterium]